jgi:hypothetical protein
VCLANAGADKIRQELAALVTKGASMPKSPESDVILPAPICDASDDPVPCMNFSYSDGTDEIRRRPASLQ